MPNMNDDAPIAEKKIHPNTRAALRVYAIRDMYTTAPPGGGPTSAWHKVQEEMCALFDISPAELKSGNHGPRDIAHKRAAIAYTVFKAYPELGATSVARICGYATSSSGTEGQHAQAASNRFSAAMKDRERLPEHLRYLRGVVHYYLQKRYFCHAEHE